MDEMQKGFGMLFVMTAYNIILGLLMVQRWIPVMTGMALSFMGMGMIFGISVMVLIPGEKPWRRPKQCKREADYWNDKFRSDGWRGK